MLKSKQVTARKQYKCDCCGHTIEIGTKYQYEFDVQDGEAYQWHLCTDCHTALDNAYILGGYTCFDDIEETSLLDTICKLVKEKGEEPERHINTLVKQFNRLYPVVNDEM